MAGANAPDQLAHSSGWRIMYSIALVLLTALLLIAAITIGPLFFEKNAYAQISSIERRGDYRDPALMAEAWALPAAKTYRSGRFEYQANASFCGPTSIANLLRSQGRSISQNAVIDSTKYEPWFGILLGGLTLDEEARLLAYRSNARAIIVRDPTLAEFPALMARANNSALRMIVNFDRSPMFGRGHGHFSPVLGYLQDHDLVWWAMLMPNTDLISCRPRGCGKQLIRLTMRPTRSAGLSS